MKSAISGLNTENSLKKKTGVPVRPRIIESAENPFSAPLFRPVVEKVPEK